MRRIYVVILLIMWVHNVWAQSASYKFYSDDDGLSNTVVYRLCKDKKNFLWASTPHGLSCFNGYTFVNYSLEYFQDRFFLGICCDSKNRIWVAGHSQSDKKLFYLENGKSTEFIFNDASRLPLLITDLYADAADRIWVLSKDKQAGYIDAKKNFIPVNIRSNGQVLKINAILVMRDSTELLATNDGVYKVQRYGQAIDKVTALPAMNYYSIAAKDRETVVFGGTGAIYTYHLGNGSVDSMHLPERKPVNSIAVNKYGNIWFNTELGYFILVNGLLQRGAAVLDHVFINQMYCDRDVVFFATNGRGLFLFNHNNVVCYDEQAGVKNPLISCIRRSGNDIYIGSYGGVYKYSSGKFELIPQIQLQSQERVNDILFSEGVMWVITPYSTWRYDPGTKGIRKVPNGGVCLCADEHGDIMEGDYDRITLLSHTDGSRLSWETGSPIIDFRTYKIIYRPGTGYWFATMKGLFNYSNGSWRKYTENNSPLASAVTGIVFDSSNNLWAATHKGLHKLGINGKWETFTEKNGMLSSHCHKLFYYDRILWIGTAAGLNSYDGKSFKAYTSGYGLPRDVEVFEGVGNSLWIASSKGAFKWDWKDEDPAPELADVVLQPEQGSLKNYKPDGSIVLPYRNNNISFDFVSPNYKMPENIVYEYRLKGANDTFVQTENRNLHFSSLSPGQYVLEIRARLRNTLVRSAVSSVAITVLKPLWMEGWFIALLAILVIIVTTFSVRKRIKYIKAREKQRTQRYTRLLQLKQEATNALISPHFIFNSLNSIQHFINRSDVVTANRFLSKFASLIRITMEKAAHTNLRLSDEMKILEKYLSLEAMRLPGLTYEINIDDTIDPNAITIPSMLIQPYAENAVWHGIMPKDGSGHVKIDIKKVMHPYLEIRIEDNGVGIETTVPEKKSKNHNSWGMEISRQRLDIIEKLTGHKVEFKAMPLYNDTELCGTLILLRVPYKVINGK